MADSVPQPNHKVARRPWIAITVKVLVVAGIITIGIFAALHFIQTKKEAPVQLKAASQQEKTYDSAINKELAAGDVVGYQSSKLQQVDLYIQLNDYGNAERVLGVIKDNVPKDKLISYYYTDVIRVAEHNQDKETLKQAYTDIVALLKSQNNPTYPAYEKKLKELK